MLETTYNEKHTFFYSFFLFINTAILAQDGSSVLDNQIRGKHKKHKALNVNNSAFDILSYDATIGIGSAYSKQIASGIEVDKRTTFIPIKANFHFPLNIVGARLYRTLADKGLIIGIDFPFSIGTGYVHYSPADATGFKMDISYEFKPGVFGMYRFNKDYDLGIKVLLGIEGNNGYIHDPGDRGWFADLHIRAKHWYFDYERFIGRSAQLSFIAVDYPQTYYTYPAINEITIKYALTQKSYLKASIVFASGNHKDLLTTYPASLTGSLPYHLFSLSFGYGQFR